MLIKTRKRKIPIEKEDTLLFISKSRKSYFSKNKTAVKQLLMFHFSQFIKYFKQANSIKKNMHVRNYPKSLINDCKKIAVYTALYGDYDEIKPIIKKNRFCDYYIFTDQQVDKESGWTKIPFDFPDDINMDNVLKNRYIKMHPHILFKNYEYSIYIDASIKIEMDIFRLMGRIGSKIIGLFKHHRGTNCLYKEAEILLRSKKYPTNTIIEQITRYSNEGFPINYGFFECTIMVRKHMDILCINTMNTWWSEFINGAKRDQLSFMYSLWKNKLSQKDIASLGETYWIEPIFSSEKHKK